MDTDIAVRCFQAIGQTHRLEMFQELARAGDQGICLLYTSPSPRDS